MKHGHVIATIYHRHRLHPPAIVLAAGDKRSQQVRHEFPSPIFGEGVELVPTLPACCVMFVKHENHLSVHVTVSFNLSCFLEVCLSTGTFPVKVYSSNLSII